MVSHAQYRDSRNKKIQELNELGFYNLNLYEKWQKKLSIKKEFEEFDILIKKIRKIKREKSKIRTLITIINSLGYTDKQNFENWQHLLSSNLEYEQLNHLENMISEKIQIIEEINHKLNLIQNKINEINHDDESFLKNFILEFSNSDLNEKFDKIEMCYEFFCLKRNLINKLETKKTTAKTIFEQHDFASILDDIKKFKIDFSRLNESYCEKQSKIFKSWNNNIDVHVSLDDRYPPKIRHKKIESSRKIFVIYTMYYTDDGLTEDEISKKTSLDKETVNSICKSFFEQSLISYDSKSLIQKWIPLPGLLSYGNKICEPLWELETTNNKKLEEYREFIKSLDLNG